MKRIIIVAVISGIISSVITFLLFFFVYPTPWFFLIIPAIMGTCIHKLGKISAEDVEGNDTLEKKVGYVCAGAVLLFIFLTIIPIIIIDLYNGIGWGILLNIPFFIVCAIAVWYGYNRGVRAVVDAYYDSNLKERDNQ